MALPKFAAVGRLFRRLRRRRTQDIALAVVLAVVAFATGTSLILKEGDGDYYQYEFAPAVRLACGGSFEGVQRPDRALQSFLADDAQSYDCDEGVTAARPDDLDIFAEGERYLFLTAAALWRVTGVSWEALAPLFGVLLAFSTLAVFGLFRLIVGPLISAVAALLVALSPTQLDMLPHLRDYAKAPFILALLLAAAIVVTKTLRTRQLILLSGATGIAAGIGLGFRTDLLAVVPFFVATVALLAPGSLRLQWRARAAAILVFVVAFGIVGSPMLRLYSEGGNAAFVTIHGLMPPFTEALGLEDPLYETGRFYNDEYATLTIQAHAALIDGYEGKIAYPSKQLDASASSLYRATTTNLPADFIVRTEAAIVQSLNIGRGVVGDDGHLVSDAARRITGPLRHLPGGSLTVVLLAVAVLAAVRLKLAAFAVFAVAYLGGLGALQYATRHVFYLELLWWLALAVCARAAFVVLRGTWRNRDQVRRLVADARGGASGLSAMFPRRWRKKAAPMLLRACVALLTVTFLAVGPLAAARAYQSGHVKDLLKRYDAAPRETLALVPERTGDGDVLLRADPALLWREQGTPGYAYLALEFDPRDCPVADLQPVLRYEGAGPEVTDYSTPLDIRFDPDRPSAVDAYALVFRNADQRFVGVQLGRGQGACLRSAAIITDTHRLPLLLNLRVPRAASDLPMYQTFTWEKAAPLFPFGRAVLAAQDVRAPTRAEIVGQPSLPWAPSPYLAPGVKLQESGWSYEGTPDAPAGYLAAAPPIVLAAGERVTVEGTLTTGALMVGLLLNNTWTSTVVVKERGNFEATVAAPERGRYTLVVANEPSGSWRTEVRIDRAIALPPPRQRSDDSR